MAILCLADDLKDLKQRLGNIIIAYRRDKSPVFCKDIKADGAMTVLLQQAMQPNIVQTLENNPALVHGGPFFKTYSFIFDISFSVSDIK